MAAIDPFHMIVFSMNQSLRFARHLSLALGLEVMAMLATGQPVQTTDVLVAGGGTGGIAAALQSARLGARTVVVEQTHWLGGMLTAAGVSCTDGNNDLVGGIWSEFRQALYRCYGTRDLATGWVSELCFEPHVADSIFKSWAAQQKNLTVLYGWIPKRVIRDHRRVTGVVFENQFHQQKTILAKITVDATELGDIFALAGAAYDLGTEEAAFSGEKMAPGKTNIIQDLTWVAVLKQLDTAELEPLARPPGYDSTQYFCCCESAPCLGAKAYPADARKMLAYGRLPAGKFMINWPAHGNDSYLNVVEDGDSVRQVKYRAAKLRTLGFVYFIQTQLGYTHLGLAQDELDHGLAFIPYNREGRRIRGVVRFNVNQIVAPFDQLAPLYRTGIAVGNYPVDHHHGQNPQTPRIDFPPIPSFNVPLGALIAQQTDGLIVCEKGISVSNIVNGATRLQPVVLLTGQAAGVLAATSIRLGCQPRKVPVRLVQQALLEAGCYLMPYADVKPDQPGWLSIQRVGVTGILRGFGKPQGWENKTYFYPDSSISAREFGIGMQSYYGRTQGQLTDSLLSVAGAIEWIRIEASAADKAAGGLPGQLRYGSQANKFWEAAGLSPDNLNRPIKRWELAVLLDRQDGVFQRKHVDLNGAFVRP
jgi:FAD dependent oxidoreductase